ncbi:MAG: OmpA family protein [Deltaproteobacteria bacterium]|nr:OmpA family protein [Deltaproteobacteria bacterium]MCB9788154.1 OmpA family protein [Deltaproteobacteria bacterium]
MSGLCCGILGLALAAMAPGARAQSDDARLGLGLKAVVQGNEKPAITVAPREALRSIEVTLKRRGDGVVQRLKAGKVAAGERKVLSFQQPVGVHTYEASFTVRWAGGDESQFSTVFDATRVGKLELQIGAGDVDLEARTLSFRITNPAASAELILLGEHGRRLGVTQVRYDGEPPGTPLRLTWDGVAGEVLAMDLKVTDIAGFWTGMRITPFHIEIPHDEVVFESGSHAIPPSEEPKLAKTLGLIREALAKHGSLLSLKLYVGGYTDTVGSRASNQGLSTRRARAIAAWFRSHGLSTPIHYQGFGEDVLARPTPDETPEAANRRAIYILASQPPTGSSVPRGDWQAL